MTALVTDPPEPGLLPILQLDDIVVLPHMRITLNIQGEQRHATIRAARARTSGRVLLVPHVDGRFSDMGTVARTEQVGQLPIGGLEIAMLIAERRARLGAAQADAEGVLWVHVEPVSAPEPSEQAHEIARRYRGLLENLFEVRGMADAVDLVREARSPDHLADISGYFSDLTLEQKVELLETVDVERRLARLVEWMTEILEEAGIKEKIKQDVTEGMQKAERDFILRQQLEAIRKQLGEGGDGVIAGFRERLAGAGMPDPVRETVEREIDRLERTSQQSPEHGWIRTYLEWMFDVPWGTRSEDSHDLSAARRVLDEDHTGLDDVKDRIIEFLAVRKLRHERGVEAVRGRGMGTIITLVGPPGTGKTSLGESVARALGRRFARISLGGIRDEAEIRGFRRTYVGAEPGRIVRALKEAGTRNPVIMLDEIDKIGQDWRGDPSSALLEVLDPAQNHTFRDHYVEVDLDLSEVLFIPTGNIPETIPRALLDRMEVIALDGYTEEEKVAIARDHLLPRQLAQAGLLPDELVVDEEAMLAVITAYTREAGVRNLERELGKVARKVATRIASGDVAPPVTVTASSVREYLGRPKHRSEAAARVCVPGVATGLAVTGTGGDVLFVEATATGDDGALTLTGQLGDVMKESAQIALSYVRSHGRDLGIADRAAARSFHLHVPEGAVPKDGPSAGVAMATALVSLLCGRAVRSSVGMTGEVTLQGLVLPVGGIKQKVLAAHRLGLREVILPRANEDDLEDLPDSVRQTITLHLADDMADVLAAALETGGADAVSAAWRAPRRTAPGRGGRSVA